MNVEEIKADIKRLEKERDEAKREVAKVMKELSQLYKKIFKVETRIVCIDEEIATKTDVKAYKTIKEKK